MERMAIFVEGYSELLFVERFIEEILGVHNVFIDKKRIRGGSRVKRTVYSLNASKSVTDQKFYFLLYDCGGEEQVKTQIMDQHASLTKAGYKMIVGMRDVRPSFTRADIPQLELGLRTRIKTALIPVEFVLAIMEIESWFLAEFNHFNKIDNSIILANVKALGFDPENDDMSQRLTPSVDLNSIYALAGKEYKKGDALTINALDYSYIYLELTNKIPYLKKLKDCIEHILA